MKFLLLLSCALACQAKSLQEEDNLVDELVHLLKKAEKADMREKRLNCPQSKVTQQDQQRIVHLHNTYRKQAGGSNMMKMEWSDSLATQAQRAADQCKLHHAFETDCEGKAAGQNGAYHSATQDVLSHIRRWYNEINGYNYADHSCSIQDCEHYTQVVWAESYLVGCGVSECSTGSYFYCNYKAQGNYGGVRPYLSGPACSQCQENNYPSGWRCEDEMCVPCNLGTSGCNECSKTCTGTDKKPDWFTWGSVQDYCQWGHDTHKFCFESSLYYLGQGLLDCPKFCCEKQGGACTTKRSMNDKKKRYFKLVEEVLE